MDILFFPEIIPMNCLLRALRWPGRLVDLLLSGNT